VLSTLPFGSLVASDPAGHVFVAGSFSQPLDLGSVVLQPTGNVDVFVAELDASGKVMTARALGLCGDGITSLAADAQGRIAVSGRAMGTVVLAADGSVQFTLIPVGSLAFDSKGDLIIAGELITAVDLGTGTVDGVQPKAGDGFVRSVDPSGNAVFDKLLPGSGVQVNGVAVDRQDAIAITGFTIGDIDLFGDVFKAQSAQEAGRVTGSFIAKLTTSGDVVFKDGVAGGSESNAVTFDAQGDVSYAGATTGNAGFDRITSVHTLDSSGADLSFATMFPATGYGRGTAIAADACGSLYVAVNGVASFPSTVQLYVVKLAD
jgi:hypothetical protein